MKFIIDIAGIVQWLVHGLVPQYGTETRVRLTNRYRMEKFIVYILKSKKSKKHYIGYTIDIEKRLKQHNAGLNRSTKYGIPWEVIYKEDGYKTRTDALKRER